MLRFTDTQQQAITAERRFFAANQRAMSERAPEATLYGNAYVMPERVWQDWDTQMIPLIREEMVVFNDLAASVQRNIPISKVMHMYRAVGDSGDINVSLDGRSRAERDKPVYDHFGTPVPIYDSVYGFGWREIEAARSEGWALEDAGRLNSAEKVARALEKMALDGNPDISVNGHASYGLRNHPMRESRSTGETLASATGAEWMGEIVATIKKLRDKGVWNPVTIYVNAADWFYASTTDFATGYNAPTIAQRVQGIEGVQRIVPSPTINANEIIAVVKDSRFVRILSAMPVTTMPMARHNFTDNYDFAVMAAAALEIVRDFEGQTGLSVSS